jgi:hypothetical protein
LIELVSSLDESDRLTRCEAIIEEGLQPLPFGQLPAGDIAVPRLSNQGASLTTNAGVAVQWTPCISTYVSYDGQLGRDRYDFNGVSGGFRISF